MRNLRSRKKKLCDSSKVFLFYLIEYMIKSIKHTLNCRKFLQFFVIYTEKILEYNLNINDIAIEFMKKRCTDVN